MGKLVPGLAAMAMLSAAAPPQDDGARATLAAELLAKLDEKAPASRRERAAAVQALARLGVHPLDGTPAPTPAVAIPFRGRVLGPGYQRGWLPAGGEVLLEQQFMAGQRATIAVAGAPAAPLVLTVAGPGEAPVCRDTPRACRWLPLFTQRYAIVLRNTGPARVRYYLVLD